MAKCKHETSNGRCGLKDCYAYRHKCYTEEFCKCHKPHTNADRIRAMSDEELISFFFLEDKCPKNISRRECDGFESCKDCWFHWLKQPAEGE